MKILSKIKGIDTLAEHNISDAVTLGTEQTVTGMKYFDKAYFNSTPFVDVDSRSVMLATMSDVPSITPLLDTGTEIASITLGTEKVYLYAPKASSVDLSDYYTSGEVDDKLSAYLPLSGGTVTGSLSIDGSLSTNSYLYAYGDVMGLVGATVNWRITTAGAATFTSLTVGGKSLAAVATSGSYNDLSDTPTIPSLANYYTKTEINTTLADFLTTSTAEKTYLTQMDAASTYQPIGSYLTSHQTIYNLTMQAGAFSAVTFDPNEAAKTVNIPTKTSHLTNDSGFVTSSELSSASVNYATSAGSATKLSTSRTIWGQSFDGTGNVSSGLSHVSTISGVVPTGGTYRRFHIGTDANYLYFQTGVHDGTSQSGNLMLCGVNTYALKSLTMKTTTASITGNLGIGTTSPSYKLHVAGSGYFTSNVLINTTTSGGTSYYLTVNGSALCSSGSWDTASDMRLKHKLHDVRLSLDAMAEAPLVRFDWIDRRDERHHIGTYAQYWQTRLPDVVNELDNGTLVLGYSELGVAMGISLAKEMLELTTRVNNEQSEIDKLKARIGELEEEIAALKSA